MAIAYAVAAKICQLCFHPLQRPLLLLLLPPLLPALRALGALGVLLVVVAPRAV